MEKSDRIRSSRQAIDVMLRSRIIPQLVEGNSEIELTTAMSSNGSATEPALESHRIQNLADCLVEGDSGEADAMFEELFAKGHKASGLILDLLGPTAIELGDRWCEDRCSFAEVTMGMSVLHTVLRKNSHRLSVEVAPNLAGQSILIAPMPGQNHLFGASIVEEFFRASNWDVHSGANLGLREMLALVADEHFSVVGLSIAENDLVDDCKDLISQVRKVSLNQELRILVGGPAFIVDPGQVQAVGADATASNALQALEIARSLNKKVG